MFKIRKVHGVDIMRQYLETRYLPGLTVRELDLSPEDLFVMFGVLA